MHITNRKLSGMGAAVVLALVLGDALTASALTNFSPFGMRLATRSHGTIKTVGGHNRIQKRSSQEITSIIGCEAKGPLDGMWAMELYECESDQM